MILLFAYPWLAAILMQKPYGYVFSVGMWAAILGVLASGFVAGAWITDGPEKLKWPGVFLLLYCAALYWILL